MSRYLDGLKKEKDWRRRLRLAKRGQLANPLDPLFEDIGFALQMVREQSADSPGGSVAKEILQCLGYVVARALDERRSFTLENFGHAADGRSYTLQDLIDAANERCGRTIQRDVMRECIIALNGLFPEGSPKHPITPSGKRLACCGRFGKVTVDDVIRNMKRSGPFVNGEDPNVRSTIKRAARLMGLRLAAGRSGPKSEPRQKGD